MLYLLLCQIHPFRYAFVLIFPANAPHEKEPPRAYHTGIEFDDTNILLDAAFNRRFIIIFVIKLTLFTFRLFAPR